MSAFLRLAGLLSDISSPTGVEPRRLDLGEVSFVSLGDVPGLAGVLAEGWERYPRLGGHEDTVASYRAWLGRRFEMVGGGDAVAVEPTPGSKSAVATLVTQAIQRWRDKAAGAGQPRVLVPDPGYPTYHAAVDAAGARVAALSEGMSVADAVRASATAEGAVAAVVITHPAAPSGRAYSVQELNEAAAVSRSAGAALIVDECYIDLWLESRPAGALEAIDDVDGVVALHTLSKRSAAAGLRSGFVAGCPRLVEEYARWNRGCGVSGAAPVQEASAILWGDDEHTEAVRRALARNWEVADRHLGGIPGYRRADSGIFVTLPVEDDLQMARRLWASDAVRVMPGQFLSMTGNPPTRPWVRLSLGSDEHVLSPALEVVRMAAHADAMGRSYA